MAVDLFAAGTVLAAPSGARILRDISYLTNERGTLRLDVYRPARPSGARPAVLLINGDLPDEEAIVRAKDWAVFHSYGEHLASRGIVGVPFAHHSTDYGRRREEVFVEVTAAIAYVRTHATEFEVQPNRLGIWAFSAGGPFLAPLLRDRPSYVRAVAGFYAIWDLAPFRDLPHPPPEADVEAWSATRALGDSALGLPPIFLARVAREAPRIKASADLFVARALALDADLELHNHPTGQHGFDIYDDDARSRRIIRAALEFFVERLS